MNFNMGFRTKNGCDWLFMTNLLHYESVEKKKKVFLPRRELNPGLLGESQVS